MAKDDDFTGYRVHTNTWTQHGKQMPVDEVMEVLDRVDGHFDAAMQSLAQEG